MSWTTSPERPTATGVRGMVATSQPLAAAAGVRALEAGGNATDAALAAAGVLAVTEPNQCGPGGDLFAIVLRDGDPPVGLDASGRSPREPGDAVPELFGPRSVTVPGCPAGWTDLAQRFSRLGLERALAPGVDLARRGFARAPKNASRWAEDWQELRGEAAEVFRPAERHANSAMADTLEAIAAGRFYRGPLAQAIAGASWLSPDDLAEHQNRCVDPVEFAYATTCCWRCLLRVRGRSPAGRSSRWPRRRRAIRWRRLRTPTPAATRRSAARRMCAPRTVTAWRCR